MRVVHGEGLSKPIAHGDDTYDFLAKGLAWFSVALGSVSIPNFPLFSPIFPEYFPNLVSMPSCTEGGAYYG